MREENFLTTWREREVSERQMPGIFLYKLSKSSNTTILKKLPIEISSHKTLSSSIKIHSLLNLLILVSPIDGTMIWGKNSFKKNKINSLALYLYRYLALLYCSWSYWWFLWSKMRFVVSRSDFIYHDHRNSTI